MAARNENWVPGEDLDKTSENSLDRSGEYDQEGMQGDTGGGPSAHEARDFGETLDGTGDGRTDQMDASSSDDDATSEDANAGLSDTRGETFGERIGDRNADTGGTIPVGEAADRAGETEDDRSMMDKMKDMLGGR